MKSVLFISIVMMFALSCKRQSSESFDRQQEIRQYMAEQKISFLDSAGIVFIINNKNCNSCVLGVLDDVFLEFKRNTKPKLFLLTKKDSALAKRILVLPNVVEIITDSGNNLQRHGLNYGDDLILEFQKRKVTDWSEVASQNLKKIKEIAGN